VTPQDTHRLSKVTLRFTSASVEREFAASVEGAQLVMVRVAIVMGIVLGSVYHFWDRLAFSDDNLWRVTFIREVIHNAWLLVLLGLSFIPALKRHARALFIAGVLAFTAFFAGINTFEDTPYIFIASGVLIPMAPYLFMIGNFVLANATAIASSLLFLAIIGISRPAGVEYTLFALLLVATNFMGSLQHYHVELLRRREFIAGRALAAERQRFRDLLVRVLPERVANRLQENRAVFDACDKVVVLFADVVGFTAMAARHQPSAVVAWLNELFRKFDAVAARHGLEKIKTIGDAYMAADGLTGEAGRCDRAVAAAAELIAVARDHLRPDGSPTLIRVGIHAGPALAGIVGESRFLYDLWGDTVNVASRMEAASRPGAVLVTPEVRDEVAALYDFMEFPGTEIRGRGAMTTWMLRGPKPREHAPEDTRVRATEESGRPQ
jgi:adenylate cyclase